MLTLYDSFLADVFQHFGTECPSAGIGYRSDETRSRVGTHRSGMRRAGDAYSKGLIVQCTHCLKKEASETFRSGTYRSGTLCYAIDIVYFVCRLCTIINH
jgi:hypothetical protein